MAFKEPVDGWALGYWWNGVLRALVAEPHRQIVGSVVESSPGRGWSFLEGCQRLEEAGRARVE